MAGWARTAGLAALGAIALGGALAAAQSTGPLGDPDDVGNVPGAPPTRPDTDYTPNAKHSDLWHWIAGAKFGERAAGSVTPDSVDLHAVRFVDENNGLAGGAGCLTPAGPDLRGEELKDYLAGCERGPVLYRYTNADPVGPQWAPVELPNPTRRGYVGAIAWISPTRVMVVGGDGNYPRREVPVVPGETDAERIERDVRGNEPNAAGRGRAWLYDGASWCELGPDSPCGTLPADVRGMTAADADPRSDDVAFAGAYGQIWRWKEGRFDRSYSADSPDSDVDAANRDAFRFRVRDLEFYSGFAQVGNLTWGSPGYDNQFHNVLAVAVTSGCCAAATDAVDSGGVNRPVLLEYDARLERWRVEPQPVDRSQTVPESYYGLAWSPGRNAVGADPVNRFAVEVVATPGAPPDSAATPLGEQRSQICHWHLRKSIQQGDFQSTDASEGCSGSAISARTSSVRLLAADGDGTPDAPISWAVGSLATTTQAVAYTPRRIHGDNSLVGRTAAQNHDVAFMLGDVQDDLGGPGEAPPDIAPAHPDEAPPLVCANVTTCQPEDPEAYTGRQTRALGSRLYRLDAYALNAFDAVGNTGVGWAVGDRGAIQRLGGEGQVASGGGAVVEPPLPEVARDQPAPVADDEPYSDRPPAVLSAQPGRVPPAQVMPLVENAPWTFVPAGSPVTSRSPDDPDAKEDVRTLVMSRDGSEGWAAGTAGAMYHYDGHRWTRCASEPVPHQLEADPACVALSPLRRATQAGARTPVTIDKLVRVPTENGDSPAESEEFRVVGIARPLGGAPILLHYEAGRWRLERLEASIGSWLDPTQPLRDVVFTSPEDGWIVARPVNPNHPQELLHFDGTRWSRCVGAVRTDVEHGCADPGLRLPLWPKGVENDHVRFAAAGRRVYLYGTRQHASSTGDATVDSAVALSGQVPPVLYPMIILRDPGEPWTADHGGLDRGCLSVSATGCVGTGEVADQGRLRTLSVTETGGRYLGWAAGEFGGRPIVGSNLSAELSALGPTAAALRFDPAAESWVRWTAADATRDYLLDPHAYAGDEQQATLADGSSFLAPNDLDGAPAANPLLGFLPRQGAWRALPTPFVAQTAKTLATGSGEGKTMAPHAGIRALEPDGAGGLWIAAGQRAAPRDSERAALGDLRGGPPATYFYRYTDRVRQPVFREVAHPLRTQRPTAAAVGPDGALWIGTDSPLLYRRDRALGWSAVRVPGWNRPRATATAAVHAIAIGAGGVGVAVGEGGRIARLSPRQAVLDPGVAVPCSATTPASGCGTGHDLMAAAVAPDGSAMVGGEALTLLWREGAGGFRPVARPRTTAQTTITGVALPTPTRAWVTTNRGQIFRGDLGAGGWEWSLENTDAGGRLLALDPVRGGEKGLAALEPLRFRAIAVDAEGNGLAVGERGLVLRRDNQGWHRIDAGVIADLTSVILGPGGLADGALVGGEDGLVLTLHRQRLELARPADYYDGISASEFDRSQVLGVGLAPTTAEGHVEAWAAVVAGPRLSQASDPLPLHLLHYASDPADPLVAPDHLVEPLPDRVAPRAGELIFAAFGKSDCANAAERACLEMGQSALVNEIVARRIVSELRRTADTPSGAQFALFTGDAGDVGGQATRGARPAAIDAQGVRTDVSLVHRRWAEMVAAPLQEAGVPVFAAVGGADLAPVRHCVGDALVQCRSTVSNSVNGVSLPGLPAALNLPWRQAFAGMPAPWGAGSTVATGSATFSPVPDLLSAARVQDVTAGDPTDSDNQLRAQIGGASTHYAVDIERPGHPAVRLVVADSSLKSLQAGDPQQNPVEQRGQLAWLEAMLCVKGSASDSGGVQSCTRERDQPAVVLSTTPTYSYGPGALVDTATDASTFEETLLRHGANLLVSGRLGWNGLSYVVGAQGIHAPCPGERYPAGPPDPSAPSPCERQTTGADTTASTDRLMRALAGTGSPAAPTVADVSNGVNTRALLPQVTASTAGGKFAVEAGAEERLGGASASDGYWHGYTVIRLHPSGDPRLTLVEQRPILDWISLEAPRHVLRPGQRMKLRGVGREPVGPEKAPRYDIIDSPSITHRYDLLEADPARQYLPRRDAGGNYVPLDPGVASIDPDTGVVRASRSNRERTFAVAVLSVGEQAASWPLVVEPRRSSAARSELRLPPPPGPAVRVLAAGTHALSAPPTAPPAAPSPTPDVSLRLPPPPLLPNLGELPSAGELPPSPPAPPRPAGGGSGVPLDIAITPTGVVVPPSLGVTAQPTPPVNPSPPSGARREAKQRQAATARSAEGAGGDDQAKVGDLANERSSPDGLAATRRDRIKPAAAGFTPLRRGDRSLDPWVLALRWGGGLLLLALALALSTAAWTPTPRRLPPAALAEARGAGWRRRL